MRIKRPNEEDANLTFEQLEELAEDIRNIILKNRSCSITEYIRYTEKIKPIELGYRLIKAIKREKRLDTFLPDQVVEILKTKKEKGVCFNKYDFDFLNKNRAKGVDWLAEKFYTSKDSIWEIAKRAGVEIQHSQHAYSKKENEFIQQNINKGWRWLSKKLNVSEDAVRKRASRMGLKGTTHGQLELQD